MAIERDLSELFARKSEALEMRSVRRSSGGPIARTIVLAAVVIIALLVGGALAVEREVLRQPVASAPASPLTKDVGDQIAALRPRLTFTPWIPGTLSPDLMGTAQLQTMGTKGGVPYLLIEYRRAGSDIVRVQVLEGPGGCCLDSTRAAQPRLVSVSGDVRGEMIPNQAQFGGPILWWVSVNGTYLSITSSSLKADEMIAFARSFRPAP